MRRFTWVGCALGIAWLVHANEPMTTQTALQSVPHDAAAFAHGALAAAREYFVTWFIDFPALALAALVSLPFVRENRLFWGAFLAAVLGLVTLNAFQFDGAFLIPHRFLLLGFTSVLIVSSMLSDRPRRGAATVVGVLLAAGVAYTSYTTVRFVVTARPEGARNWNQDKVFPLPYNRARLDKHIWLDRIEDAKTIVGLIKRGTESHVIFYGFSAAGEDSVNPQLFVSRILLPLGYDTFSKRVAFFDLAHHMYFPFPVHPMATVPSIVQDMRLPLYVHVREPEQSAASLIAKYFNRAQVTPVDLGLRVFKSYRVDAFAPRGPIPVPPLAPDVQEAIASSSGTFANGFCVTKWLQDASEHSPLRHEEASLPASFNRALEGAQEGGSKQYVNVTRRFRAVVGEMTDRPSIVYATGYYDNQTGAPMRVTLSAVADDEVAVLVNDQTILESQLLWKSSTRYTEDVLLPPGLSQVKVIYHKYWHPGGVAFAATDDASRPVAWRCDTSFH